MQRDVKAILDGALGGAVGTAAMSAVMLAAGESGLMGEHPPDKIAGALLGAMGVRDPDEGAQDAVAVALHFGFGIATGALFGVMHRRLPRWVPAGLHGVVFGTLVWAASYQGWVPALGIMPPASEDRPDRPKVMLLAHWVFGAVLGAIIAARDDRDARMIAVAGDMSKGPRTAETMRFTSSTR